MMRKIILCTFNIRWYMISFLYLLTSSLNSFLSRSAIWIKEMGIDQENRHVEVVFENNEIVIRKK